MSNCPPQVVGGAGVGACLASFDARTLRTVVSNITEQLSAKTEILDCERDSLLSTEFFLSSDSRVNPA